MNVLCVKINDAEIPHELLKIKVGEIYTVVDIIPYKEFDFYELSFQKGVAYREDQFVKIDPTEEDLKEFEEENSKKEVAV